MAYNDRGEGIDSGPLLGTDYSLEPQPKKQYSPLLGNHGCQKSSSKWLIYCVLVPYIPLLILGVALYLKSSSRPPCLTNQLDVFPCKRLSLPSKIITDS